MEAVRIGGRAVGEGAPVFIVAEVGKNHNHDIDLAKRLIDEAKDAGCDAVKFQSHMAGEEMLVDDTVPPHFPEPRYQYISRMSLTREEHVELFEYACKRGILFYSTPFSKKAADLLEEIGVEVFKIGSGDVTDLPLIEHIARKGKPIILSTGMSSIEEIDEAVQTILKINSELILMHCTSLYPSPYGRLNLRVIRTLKDRYRLPVGLSDHSPEIYSAIAAVPLGASAIEKHFTLDKSLYGPDHKASITPSEMRALVYGVRSIEKALGDGVKKIYPEEEEMRRVFQKSVVTAREILAGTVVTPEMLTTKRPGRGIKPRLIKALIGRRAKRLIPPDTLLTTEDFE